MPDRRAGEAVHDGDAEPGGRARGVLHLLGRSLLDPFGPAVAPHARRDDGPMPLVDAVADRLPDEVISNREHLQAMASEQIAPAGTVAIVGEGALDVEVVAPARQLEAVVAPLA